MGPPLLAVLERRPAAAAACGGHVAQVANSPSLPSGCLGLPQAWPQGVSSRALLTPKSAPAVGPSVSRHSCQWPTAAAQYAVSPNAASGPGWQWTVAAPPARTAYVITYPPGWGPPSSAGLAPARTSAPTAVMAVASSSCEPTCAAEAEAEPPRLLLPGLPGELLQTFADWLPSFGDRARYCLACQAARSVEWRLAPPFEAEEELSNIGLGDRGARAVALAFLGRPNPPAIGELCLGSNRIGDAGARAIAEVLRSGSAVRRLSLRDNEIGDAGAEAIAAALAANSALEELDLWGNPLGEQGKRALLTAARCKVFLHLHSPRTAPLTPRSLHGHKLRTVLFDWISQVHTGGNAPVALDGEADPQDMLFRTLGHLDAYLSLRHVHRGELQLAGVACALAGLHSGSLQEEEPELAAWLAFVTDGACTAEDVRRAAAEVRQVLGFRMHQPTAYTFLRRYLRKTGWTQESFSLANYLIELAVISSEFMHYRPQAIAAAATVLSRQYLSQGIGFQNIPCWKAKLLRCTNLDLEKELAPCAAEMSRLHASEHGCNSKFVNRKYEWTRLHMVGKIKPNPPSDAAFFSGYLRGELSP